MVINCSLVQRIRGMNGLVRGYIGFHVIFFSTTDQGNERIGVWMYWVSCYQLQSMSE